MELIGKNVIVLGANGGLGREFVDQLRADGAHVFGVGRLGGNAASCDALADVRSFASLEDAVASLALPSIDGIVNATGRVAFGSFAVTPSDIVDELFAVNATGTINSIRLAQRYVAPEGFLVSMTGVAGDLNVLGMGPYCASKAAAKSAMAVAQRELRGQKIMVLDARPGHTETTLSEHPIFGTRPQMPTGLDPTHVVRRVLTALRTGEKDLPADAFVDTVTQ